MKANFIATVAALVLTGLPVMAEEYPDHAIRVIVPHGAGGSTDIMTRLVSKPLSEQLGQGIAVVNVPGGGTSIGAQQAANAKADGYTLALTHIALLTSSAMGANPLGPESLTPIAQIGSETQIIAVPTDSEVDDLKEFMSLAASETSEQLKLGVSPGAGNHFAFLRMLRPIEENDVIFVPTGGGGPSMHELLGKHIDVGTFVVSEAIDQIQAGNIRPLAVFSKERHPDLSDVPTAAEQGYDMEIGLNYVLYGPKDIPEDRVAVLSDAVKATLDNEDFQKEMLSRSIEPAFATGEPLKTSLEETWVTIQELASGLQGSQ